MNATSSSPTLIEQLNRQSTDTVNLVVRSLLMSRVNVVQAQIDSVNWGSDPRTRILLEIELRELTDQIDKIRSI
jgi:hypothetical protein